MGKLGKEINMAYLIYNNKQHYIYIHIPKTGGTTIRNTFKKRHSFPEHSFEALGGHISLKDIKNRIKEYNKYITFTTVRNPWSWYVSWYFYLKEKYHRDVKPDEDFLKEYKILNNNSFTDFVKYIYDERDNLVFYNDGDNTPKYQQMLEWAHDGEKYVDHFIKIEELSEDKLRNMGLYINYIHTMSNRSKHNHYSIYYDDTTKTLVQQMHKDDIKFFNYKFKE